MLRENRDIRTSAGDRLHFAISTLRLFQPSVRPGDVRRAADSVVGPQSSDDRGAKSRSKDSTWDDGSAVTAGTNHCHTDHS